MGDTTHVFVVEDDDSFFKILSIRLRSWRPDLSITVAKTIAEAKKILKESELEFSLAILDQHLPDGRGDELLTHERLSDLAVLAVSSDDAPDLPARVVRAGAQHFLGKRQVSEPLFIPLVEALVERKKLVNEIVEAKIKESRLASIRRLLATLRHEINNPLGAVLGGAYLLRSTGELDEEQSEALKLIEESGKRINHVISQLCDTAELEEVTKSREEVYQVPGDKSWEDA